MNTEGKTHPGRTEAVTPQFDELYLQYKEAVFSFAFYLTRNQPEAEDLFQETWLRVIKHLPENAEIQDLKPWIFTIVANLYRDLLRKKRIRNIFPVQRYILSRHIDSAFSGLLEKPLERKRDETTRVDTEKDISNSPNNLEFEY